MRRRSLSRTLAYTFHPAPGAAGWLLSADAEGRSRLGRRPGLRPARRVANDREL
jgi:hypothetical protein